MTANVKAEAMRPALLAVIPPADGKALRILEGCFSAEVLHAPSVLFFRQERFFQDLSAASSASCCYHRLEPSARSLFTATYPLIPSAVGEGLPAARWLRAEPQRGTLNPEGGMRVFSRLVDTVVVALSWRRTGTILTSDVGTILV